MKKLLILFFPMLFFGCDENIKNNNLVKKEKYVCNENNSLYFYDFFGKEKIPNKINFNSDVLKFCEKNGNVLTYRPNGCGEAGEVGKNLDEVLDDLGSIIRYDFVLEEIILNNPPRQIIMKCIGKD